MEQRYDVYRIPRGPLPPQYVAMPVGQRPSESTAEYVSQMSADDTINVMGQQVRVYDLVGGTASESTTVDQANTNVWKYERAPMPPAYIQRPNDGSAPPAVNGVQPVLLGSYGAGETINVLGQDVRVTDLNTELTDYGTYSANADDYLTGDDAGGAPESSTVLDGGNGGQVDPVELQEAFMREAQAAGITENDDIFNAFFEFGDRYNPDRPLNVQISEYFGSRDTAPPADGETADMQVWKYERAPMPPAYIRVPAGGPPPPAQNGIKPTLVGSFAGDDTINVLGQEVRVGDLDTGLGAFEGSEPTGSGTDSADSSDYLSDNDAGGAPDTITQQADTNVWKYERAPMPPAYIQRPNDGSVPPTVNGVQPVLLGSYSGSETINVLGQDVRVTDLDSELTDYGTYSADSGDYLSDDDAGDTPDGIVMPGGIDWDRTMAAVYEDVRRNPDQFSSGRGISSYRLPVYATDGSRIFGTELTLNDLPQTNQDSLNEFLASPEYYNMLFGDQSGESTGTPGDNVPPPLPGPQPGSEGADTNLNITTDSPPYVEPSMDYEGRGVKARESGDLRIPNYEELYDDQSGVDTGTPDPNAPGPDPVLPTADNADKQQVEFEGSMGSDTNISAKTGVGLTPIESDRYDDLYGDQSGEFTGTPGPNAPDPDAVDPRLGPDPTVDTASEGSGTPEPPTGTPVQAGPTNPLQPDFVGGNATTRIASAAAADRVEQGPGGLFANDEQYDEYLRYALEPYEKRMRDQFDSTLGRYISAGTFGGGENREALERVLDDYSYEVGRDVMTPLQLERMRMRGEEARADIDLASRVGQTEFDQGLQTADLVGYVPTQITLDDLGFSADQFFNDDGTQNPSQRQAYEDAIPVIQEQIRKIWGAGFSLTTDQMQSLIRGESIMAQTPTLANRELVLRESEVSGYMPTGDKVGAWLREQEDRDFAAIVQGGGEYTTEDGKTIRIYGVDELANRANIRDEDRRNGYTRVSTWVDENGDRQVLYDPQTGDPVVERVYGTDELKRMDVELQRDRLSGFYAEVTNPATGQTEVRWVEGDQSLDRSRIDLQKELQQAGFDQETAERVATQKYQDKIREGYYVTDKMGNVQYIRGTQSQEEYILKLQNDLSVDRAQALSIIEAQQRDGYDQVISVPVGFDSEGNPVFENRIVHIQGSAESEISWALRRQNGYYEIVRNEQGSPVYDSNGKVVTQWVNGTLFAEERMLELAQENNIELEQLRAVMDRATSDSIVFENAFIDSRAAQLQRQNSSLTMEEAKAAARDEWSENVLGETLQERLAQLRIDAEMLRIDAEERMQIYGMVLELAGTFGAALVQKFLSDDPLNLGGLDALLPGLDVLTNKYFDGNESDAAAFQKDLEDLYKRYGISYEKSPTTTTDDPDDPDDPDTGNPGENGDPVDGNGDTDNGGGGPIGVPLDYDGIYKVVDEDGNVMDTTDRIFDGDGQLVEDFNGTMEINGQLFTADELRYSLPNAQRYYEENVMSDEVTRPWADLTTHEKLDFTSLWYENASTDIEWDRLWSDVYGNGSKADKLRFLGKMLSFYKGASRSYTGYGDESAMDYAQMALLYFTSPQALAFYVGGRVVGGVAGDVTGANDERRMANNIRFPRVPIGEWGDGSVSMSDIIHPSELDGKNYQGARVSFNDGEAEVSWSNDMGQTLHREKLEDFIARTGVLPMNLSLIDGAGETLKDAFDLDWAPDYVFIEVPVNGEYTGRISAMRQNGADEDQGPIVVLYNFDTGYFNPQEVKIISQKEYMDAVQNAEQEG